MIAVPAVETPKACLEDILAEAHRIGREALRPHAAEVDRDARFPQEAFAALREAKLLSAYVPREFGGMGLNIFETAKLCEVLGQYCGSSAMIYAMHAIQAACIVHHAQSSDYFLAYMRRMVDEQLLLASATTELGVGGDLRSSLCAIECSGSSFSLTKQAPVISYGAYADGILVTCRRSADSPASEQVHVLVHRDETTLKPLSGWDTMGFRGTCSSGSVLSSTGDAQQILPAPFAEILSQTMHPFSHIVWSSLWTGIATDAVNRARAFVRAEARKSNGETPISAIRLAEVDQVLQRLRHDVSSLTDEYFRLLQQGCSEAFHSFGFSIRTNNLKVSSSQLLVDIVGRAMLICGIAGYRNDSQYTVARHLRDAYGAALMVNNDRINKLNATMLMVHKEG